MLAEPAIESGEVPSPSSYISNKASLYHCAECGKAAHDAHELYRHNHESQHLTAECGVCKEKFRGPYQLDTHASKTGHLASLCAVSGCNKQFFDNRAREAHCRRDPHSSGHSLIETGTPFECVQCKKSLTSKTNLLRHAKEEQHQPYACECGSQFSRLDVLHRHLEKYSKRPPQHPCQYCNRHRGPKAFRRADHLKQHLRNYHHLEVEDEARISIDFPVCPHSDCPKYRGAEFQLLPRRSKIPNQPFTTKSEYSKHMRDEHNECTFPCDVQGCSRVGRRGYFREKDLLKHRKKQHPEAAPYQVEKREEVHYKCTQPGCIVSLTAAYMGDHIRYDHHIWQ
jgi:hypothetical protein